VKTRQILLSVFFLFALSPLHSQTVNITEPGWFGIDCSEYVNNMNRTWNIQIPEGGTLVLSYGVNTESGFDKVLVYSIDDSGEAVLQATLTGAKRGRFVSLFGNGKMRVVFTTDYSVNCSTNSAYSGLGMTVFRLASAAGTSYYYDDSGNRTSRTIVLGPLLRDAGAEEVEEEAPDVSEAVGPDGFEAAVRIYPNPTEGRFTVEIGAIPDELQGEISLYDTQGKLLQKKTFLKENRIDFDLSRNSAGMYVLHTRLGEKTSTWKIIKK
jgi:YD repeat-containing protein